VEVNAVGAGEVDGLLHVIAAQAERTARAVHAVQTANPIQTVDAVHTADAVYA
jgi:hypothetical protein